MQAFLPSSMRRGLVTLALAITIAATLGGGGSARAQSANAFGTDQRFCNRSALSQILSTSQSNLIGSAAGAALGGLLGNQIGKGSGNTLATIAGVVGGALAGGYVGRSMDPTDQACVGQTLENTPTSQTVAWQNPDSGSRYWVTPTGEFQGPNGEPCRNYITQAVVNGATQRTDSAACREGNGAWKPVSARGQATSRPPQVQQPAADNSLSTDTILKVQQRLREQGFYVRDNIDGQWGPRTMTAVQNFQRANSLNPTGQLDLQTLAALGLSQNPGQQQTSPPSQ